jgi:tellurite resistance protein TehA-like permease
LSAAGAPVWGSAATAVSAASSIAATALWGFGLWWLAAAAILLAVYLRKGSLPYGLGWWAFTFPLGAYTASTLALARTWHASLLEGLTVVLFAILALFWIVVAVGTLKAVAIGQIWRR